jgi:hypothetical protein
MIGAAVACFIGALIFFFGIVVGYAFGVRASPGTEE